VLVAIDLGPSTLEPSAPTFPGNQLLVLIGRGESVGSDHFFQQMWGTAIHFNIDIYIYRYILSLSLIKLLLYTLYTYHIHI
jgi:hypothetical protein